MFIRSLQGGLISSPTTHNISYLYFIHKNYIRKRLHGQTQQCVKESRCLNHTLCDVGVQRGLSQLNRVIWELHCPASQRASDCVPWRPIDVTFNTTTWIVVPV